MGDGGTAAPRLHHNLPETPTPVLPAFFFFLPSRELLSRRRHEHRARSWSLPSLIFAPVFISCVVERERVCRTTAFGLGEGRASRRLYG